LPCLSLEESTGNVPNEQSFLDRQNKKQWEDLSHLPLESKTGQLSNRFLIYETRTTVVISGCSNTDWFGFALGNIGPVHTSPDDDDDGADAQNDLRYSDMNHDPEPEEDFFATGGYEPVLNPDNMIWDPRIYFLRATEMRLCIATQASEYLVRKLDAGCHDWVSRHCT
jgi:hypothetical protein